MAGGVLKTFGAIFLVVGILGVLAAAGAAAYALTQEEENQDRGLFQDGHESDDNQQRITGAAIGGAVALGLLILGIVLMVAGGRRAQRAIRKEIRQAHQETTAMAKDTPAAKASKPRQAAGTGIQEPSDAPSRGKVVAIMAAVGVLVIAAVVIAVLMVGDESGDAVPTSKQRADGVPADARLLQNETYGGTIRNMVMMLGGSRGAGQSDTQFDFTPAAGAMRLRVVLTWDPQPQGTAQMDLYVTQGDVELARATGSGPLVLDATGGLGGEPFVINVYPEGDAGVVVEQSYSFTVTTWGA